MAPDGEPDASIDMPYNAESISFLEGLMPKEEIGAKRFLKNYPEFDGRGVLVAIFDSGVDPGAAGLQVTSDGKPKILDVLDCTGSGDVDTSTVVKADEKGYITGASGTKLQVNPLWENPTQEWRIGSKRVFELYSDSLVRRVKGERKKKWDAKHRSLVTEAVSKLAEFDSKNGKASLDLPLKKEREELQSRIDLLKKMADSHDDVGPILDAVVWHDGSHWRAALDTRDLYDREEEGEEGEETKVTGKLADFTPMTNYKYERQFGTFSRVDACNFVLNIYNDGNVLSIVTDVSSHGTHVAGITAAFHPQEPSLNGVAPGAQIISCKIGDTRLGSMETGTGVTRALVAVIEHKCDLINMSYGEPTTFPNHGRFIQLATEVVHKHGVIFVSSAGNNGPALTTVGAPGGTSSAILGVGAYVSPRMAASSHSIVAPPDRGLPYTWSSRGPTPDGDFGVDVSAPGGAVAPVSQWSLQRRQLMNGTSMSSPCACGATALVLSAVKGSGQVVAPHLVRQALVTSADISGWEGTEGTLAMGAGLLQVDKAFEYMQRCQSMPDRWYDITVTNTANSVVSRGIYLREPHETTRSSEFRVSVSPVFHEDGDNLDLRLPFEEKIALTSTAPWLKAPENVLLANNGRTFNVVVDPTQLPEGVHVAQLLGTDMEAPWRGSILRLLVTVVKPVHVAGPTPAVDFTGLAFSPGHIERRFVAVPPGATWAEITLSLSDFDTPRMFLLHALQMLPRHRYSHSELKSYLSFPSPASKHFSHQVHGGGTLELTLAQFWSSGSGSKQQALANVKISFHGLTSDTSTILLNGNIGCTRLDIQAQLAADKVAPTASLNRLQIPFRPAESKLESLGPWRDLLPNDRQIHSLLLTYKVSLSESGSYRPRIPLLNHRLYENEIEGQFFMLFDANKRLVSQGNVYPEAVKLKKGEYVLRLLLRHDKLSLLEKLKNISVIMERKLDEKSTIKLSLHTSIDGALSGEDTFKPSLMIPGEKRVLYIAGPAEEKLPKDAVPGTSLLGKLVYGRLSTSGNSVSDSQAAPAKALISYSVPLPSVKSDEKSANTKSSEESKPTAAQKLKDEIRDAKLKVFDGLPRGTKEEIEEYETLAKELKVEYPDHIPLLTSLLRHADEEKSKTSSGDEDERFKKIIEAADAVIQAIDSQALALFFGVKSDPEAGPEATKLKKDMEFKKDVLVDALYRKGMAMVKQEAKTVEVKKDLSKESTQEPSVVDEVQNEDMEPIPAPASLDSHGGPPIPGSGSQVIATLTAEPISEEESIGNGAAVNGKSASSESMVASSKEPDEFEQNFAEIKKWVDVTSPKHALLAVNRERRAGRPGLALQVLNQMLEDESKPADKSLHEIKVELLKELKYGMWAEYESKWNTLRFPKAYPLF